MSFASRAVSMSNRMIAKYGSYVVLNHKYNCAYNPQAGKEVCTNDTYEFKGAISAYTVQQSDLTTVTNGDLSVLVQTDMDITKNWTVTYAGKEWEVINITKTTAQDTTIVQRLHIRALSR